MADVDQHLAMKEEEDHEDVESSIRDERRVLRIIGSYRERKKETLRNRNVTAFALQAMDEGHHVHFPEDITANTEIQLHMKGDSIANVHLGFLQHRHKYEIQFHVPVSPGSKSLKPLVTTPFVAVGEVKCQGQSHQITLELDAHKEGLLRDKFVLKNEADEEFVIVLHARVLGCRKGTPMLKDGIRCISVEKDDEEEHSDWQGFD